MSSIILFFTILIFISMASYCLCVSGCWSFPPKSLHNSFSSKLSNNSMVLEKSNFSRNCLPLKNETTGMSLRMPSTPIHYVYRSLSASFNRNTNWLKRRELINNSTAHVFIIIYSLLQVIIRIIKAKRACICKTPIIHGTNTHMCAQKPPLPESYKVLREREEGI